MILRTAELIRTLPVVYDIRRRRYRSQFLKGVGGRFWGVFDSRNDAIAGSSDPLRTSYDDDSLVDMSLESFLKLQLFDWPALYWITSLIREHRYDSLLDLGGHIGVKYYAYRDYLQIPESFRWQVVEVKSMVRAGRTRAEELGCRHLEFFEHLQDAKASPLLFCSGALQYLDSTLPELLQAMPAAPQAIVLNKVPTSSAGGCCTLESFDADKQIPYRIHGEDELAEMRESLGYAEISRWRIPDRDFQVPFSRPSVNVELGGAVWRKKSDSDQRK